MKGAGESITITVSGAKPSAKKRRPTDSLWAVLCVGQAAYGGILVFKLWPQLTPPLMVGGVIAVAVYALAAVAFATSWFDRHS